MDFFDFIKTHKSLLLIISFTFNILLVIVCGILGYLYFNYECDCECNCPSNIIKEVKEKENVEEQNEKVNEFYVEVKGAVNKPGVYKVNNNNIINDVIVMAEGLTKDAYTDNINLSKKVSKELVVYIYTKNDFKKDNKVIVNDKNTECVCPSYDISVCTTDLKSEIVTDNTSVDDKENVNEEKVDNNPVLEKDENEVDKKDDSEKVSDTLNKKININIATKNELMKLSGIGESKAQKIIDYRNTNGLFKSIEDIKKVSGIGEAIYAKIKDNITI